VNSIKVKLEVYKRNVELDLPGAKQALETFRNDRVKIVKTICEVSKGVHSYFMELDVGCTLSTLSCAKDGLRQLKFELVMRS
jgi:hypothetical protein